MWPVWLNTLLSLAYIALNHLADFFDSIFMEIKVQTGVVCVAQNHVFIISAALFVSDNVNNLVKMGVIQVIHNFFVKSLPEPRYHLP